MPDKEQPENFRHALSVACLEFVARRLAERGIRPNQSLVAQELGIKQPRISRIISDRDSLLDFRTITEYASKYRDRREHETGEELVAEVLLELHRLATEITGVAPRPVVSTEKESRRLFERCIEETQAIKERIWRSPQADAGTMHLLYREAVSRAFRTLSESSCPATMVGVAFRRGEQWKLVACGHSPHEAEPRVYSILREVPTDFANAIEQSCQARRTGELETDVVVSRPGSLGDNSEVGFWEELTLRSGGLVPAKVRVFAEPVLDSVYKEQSSPSTFVFYLFEYRFVPDQSVRSAMTVLSDAVHRTYAQELLSWTACLGQRRSLSQGTTAEPLKDFCSRLWSDETVKPIANRLEMWSPGSTPGEFSLAYQIPDSQANLTVNGKRAKKQRIVTQREWSDWNWGPRSDEWESMTNHVLIHRSFVFWDPQRTKRESRRHSSGSLAMGFYLTIGDDREYAEDRLPGACYLWCSRAVLAMFEKVAERIQALAREIPNLNCYLPGGRASLAETAGVASSVRSRDWRSNPLGDRSGQTPWWPVSADVPAGLNCESHTEKTKCPGEVGLKGGS